MVPPSASRVPCNPKASAEVHAVLNYLAQLEGKGILTGQHTQTHEQKELRYIEAATGRLPALCGFELLAYSPNIQWDTCDADCRLEIEENRGTLERAWDWALNKKGLVTFTWHWYSPLGGRDKSFYAKNTDFDPRRAVVPGTPEHTALLSDMDHMAELLKEFRDRRVPILWRPFHEAEGTWFWWGSQGPGPARELYRLMFERFTKVHELDNLIWVWNSPVAEGYVGDDVADIISRDLYVPAHEHTDLKKQFDELRAITPADKLTALGEVGVLPSVAALAASRVPWLWYMTWSNDFGATEKFNSLAELKAAYDHPYAVTLERLPKLF